MPTVASEYEALEEFSKIASQLKNKYPHVFVGDISKVRCVVITNKERPPAHKSYWDVKAVPMPIKMDCPYSYYVILYSKDWTEFSEKGKRLLVSDILLAIPAEDDGKVNAFDLKDYATMVRTFGPDYIENTKAKDPIDDTVEWICRD